MERKYSRRLIMDYVAGNDIEGYDINELENDYQFMIEVIDFTKDKNMYNLCSDEIKRNYNFVRFLVEKFKDDYNFIDQVSSYFFVNHENKSLLDEDHKVLELKIIINDIIGKNKIDVLEQNKIVSHLLFNLENTFAQMGIGQLPQGDQRLLGLGFAVLKDKYNDSQIITDFFAKKYIDEIFYETVNKLADMLHRDFKDYDSLLKYGVNKYIAKVVSLADNSLAEYLLCHTELLTKIKDDIQKIGKDWNRYEQERYRDKIEQTYEKIEDYLNENFDTTIFPIDAVNYIVEYLGLKEIFDKYDETDFGEYKDILMQIEPEHLSFNDLVHLKKMIKIVKKIFDSDEVEDDYIEEEKTSLKKTFNKRIVKRLFFCLFFLII